MSFSYVLHKALERTFTGINVSIVADQESFFKDLHKRQK